MNKTIMNYDNTFIAKGVVYGVFTGLVTLAAIVLDIINRSFLLFGIEIVVPLAICITVSVINYYSYYEHGRTIPKKEHMFSKNSYIIENNCVYVESKLFGFWTVCYDTGFSANSVDEWVDKKIEFQTQNCLPQKIRV